MINNIEKFDPSKLMDGVRDRVKATFVSLIPDEQWEQMIKTECDRFFAPFKEREYYNRTKDLYSDFQLCCLSVMTEIAKEKVKEALVKYESTIWNNNEFVVGDLLKELLTKHASEIFAAIMGNKIQTIINDLKNRSY